MNNQTSQDMNGNSIEHNQLLKEEIQNDSASVMTGNDDNMDLTNDDENEEQEESGDEIEDLESTTTTTLRDYPPFSQLQKEKDNVLYLMDIGMSFIESLTKATKENIDIEEAKDECKHHISDYYETLMQIKTNLAKYIYMSSLKSPLNYEGSLYTERKRLEIETKKAKILTLEPSRGKSANFTDDFSSVNAFNNLDNISQSNISYGNTAQTPSIKM